MAAGALGGSDVSPSSGEETVERGRGMQREETGRARRGSRRAGWRAPAGLAAALAAACAGAPEPVVGPDPTAAGDPAVDSVAPELRVTPPPGRPAPGEPVPLPIPPRIGPLELTVVYPARGQRILPDSNFLFGTVGTGDATLSIEGAEVPVEPNGAFLAWLPVPEPDAGGTAVYRLEARGGPEVRRLELPVRRGARGPPDGAERPWLALRPRELLPERWVQPGETFRFTVQGEPGLDVALEAGSLRVPLEETRADGRLGRYEAEVEAGRLREASCAAGACRAGSHALAPEDPADPEVELRVDTLGLVVRAAGAGRATRSDLRLPLAVIEPRAEPGGRLREAPDSVNGWSGVVVGRPTPFGPYRWRFPEGTVVRVTGRLGDRLRIRLAEGLDAWVLAEDVAWGASPGSEPATVRDLRVESAEDRLTLRLGLSTAVPAQVTQTGARTLVLTLFDAVGETDRMAYGPRDPFLEALDWSQLPGPRYRLAVRLDRPVWGYRLELESGDATAYEGPRGPGADAAGGRGPILRLDLRRPPAIDRAAPLRGRRIAVDPGHPGGGSYGPTGYYEGDANLEISRQLVTMLTEAGATPILIRGDRLAVGLYDRTRLAREAGAELFVSIHNNALPDGIRPFGREGTSTYYHHPHARDLAAAVQAGMVDEMGLRDLGHLWGDLAVARMSWMPSVLAEGAFMMMPSHEAALRSPDFQARYARGVMQGLEVFLRARAGAPPPHDTP